MSQALMVVDYNASAVATVLTARQVIDLLLERLPILVYDGEDNLNLPLEHLGGDELADAFGDVKAFFGERDGDAGVTANAIPYRGINIPVSHLENMAEERALALLELIRPSVELNSQRAKNEYAFRKLSGMRALSMWGNQHHPAGVMIPYAMDGETDPIRHLAETLNGALGEPLFSGVVVEGDPPKAYRLFISEDDIVRLVQSPHFARAEEIFARPRAASHPESGPEPARLPGGEAAGRLLFAAPLPA